MDDPRLCRIVRHSARRRSSSHIVWLVVALSAAGASQAAAVAAAGVRDQGSVTVISSRGWSGDGGPATAALLNDPHQVAPLADGGFLIADTGNDVIRKVDASGVITTVAGRPMKAGYAGDGGPATAATLDQPMGVADLGGGAFAIADTGNHAIRIVSADGSISTLGDPSALTEPRALAAENGLVVVADAARNQVFVLSATGALSPVAGTGSAGTAGDGGPATSAQLDDPTSVSFDDAGDIVIADSGNRLVRQVDPTGAITTIATLPGTADYVPVAVAVGLAPDGGVLIGDANGVSDLESDGTLSPIAGTGLGGFNGDSGDATKIDVGAVDAVASTADGSVLISDGGDDRVRELTTDGQLTTVAGSGKPRVAEQGSSSVAFAPPAAATFDVGACPGLPFVKQYAVRFPYTLDPPIPTQRHATINVYSSANAYLTLTITRPHQAARHVTRSISENSTSVSLGTLKPGTYDLTARAHYRDTRARSEYSCATDSIRVR